jgi:hypothetical protein
VCRNGSTSPRRWLIFIGYLSKRALNSKLRSLPTRLYTGKLRPTCLNSCTRMNLPVLCAVLTQDCSKFHQMRTHFIEGRSPLLPLQCGTPSRSQSAMLRLCPSLKNA